MIIVSPTPSVLPSLVRHLITGISLGLIVGLVYVAFARALEWQVLVRLINLGMLLGILRWLLTCARLPASHRNRTNSVEPRPVHRPRPFNNRLSHFLHRPEEELQERPSRFISRMRYWSCVSLSGRHGPKPAWFIRQLLERIHNSVRGDKC